MPRTQLRNDSATDCGAIPQGKGREGIRNGKEEEPFQDQSSNLEVGALCSCSADAHPTVSATFLGLEPMA